MRILLDACVLYPTVMREILLSIANHGLFVPLWSDRILDEWARAVAKNLPDQAELARGEIALVRAVWSDAVVPENTALEQRLFLPDKDDRHVFAAAINGCADVLLTLNAKDFPTRVLAKENIIRRDPDSLLHGFWQDHPGVVTEVCETVRDTAESLSGRSQPLRALLKRARLPKLGKALA